MMWPFKRKATHAIVFPPLTRWMRDQELKWAHVKDTDDFIMVCDFCGGNCGQCGLTSIVGNVPADMQHMIDNLLKENS